MPKIDYTEDSEGRRAIFPAKAEDQFPKHWRVVKGFYDPYLDANLLIVEGDNRFPKWIRGETVPFVFINMQAFERMAGIHSVFMPGESEEPARVIGQQIKPEWRHDSDHE